jgi:hypothetical protein
MGRVVRGAKCPWGEMSVGRVVLGASCPGASCPGASCLGRVVREPSGTDAKSRLWSG